MTSIVEFLAVGSWLLTLALILVLALRPLVRKLFGPGPTYALWLLPGLVCCVAGFAPRPAGPRILATDLVNSNSMTQSSPDAGPVGLAALLFCWALGVLILATITWVRQRNFRSQLKSTVRTGNIDGIPLLASPNISTPMASGLVNKQILVPKSFETTNSLAARQLILQHELAHLRRNDPLANLVANVVCTLFWFHPLVHWANSRLRLDQELSCDAAVLQEASHQRRIYGNALLNAAISNSQSASSWLSSKAQLKRRLKALATPAKPKAIRVTGFAIVTTVILLVSGVSQRLLPQEPPQRILDVSQHSLLLKQMSKRELSQNLLHAVEIGDTAPVKQLLCSGADIEFETPNIGTPLIHAARQGHFGLVKLLVENQADVNAGVLTAGSPLIMAAKYGRGDIADFLIKSGSDVNAHVFLDETPLINAARFGHIKMVKSLIEAGAEVQKTVTTFSITHLPLGTKSPLSEAQRVGHLNVVNLLKSVES